MRMKTFTNIQTYVSSLHQRMVLRVRSIYSYMCIPVSYVYATVNMVIQLRLACTKYRGQTRSFFHSEHHSMNIGIILLGRNSRKEALFDKISNTSQCVDIFCFTSTINILCSFSFLRNRFLLIQVTR